MILSIKKDSNLLQAFWVGFGSFSSFALAIISVSILSRYLNKHDYGTYRQIIYVYTTLLVIFSAGLPRAYSYFLPKQNMEQAKILISTLTKLFLILGLILSAFLFFLAPLIATILNNPDLEKGLKLFCIIPLLMMPTLGIEGIYASIRKTHFIAIYNICTRLFMLLCITLPVIIFKGSYITAIFGLICSSFLTFLLALYLKNKPFKNYTNQKPDYNVKDIFKYTVPLMLASVFGIGIKFADQFYISHYFGAETFAEFSNGFIELPFVKMITGAASTVLMPLFAKSFHNNIPLESITKTWRNTLTKSAMLIYPILIFFYLFSNDTVTLLYGSKYASSTIYFNIALTINFFNIIIFAPLLFSMGESRLYSTIHLIVLLVIWPLEFLAIKIFNTPVSIAIVSVSVTISNIMVFLYITSVKLKVKFITLFPLWNFSKVIIHSLIVALLIKTTFSYLPLDNKLLVKYLVSMIIYAIILIYSGKVFNLDYLSIVRTLKRNETEIK